MRRALSALLVALAAACATAPAAPRATPVGDASAEEALVREHARLLAMTDARRRDTALVDELLASRHPSVRAAAALAVGQVRMTERAPRLRRLAVRSAPTAPSDSATAASAVFALGLMQDTASAGALGAVLDDERRDPEAALEAAWALGELGPAGRAALESALGTAARHSPAVLTQVLYAVSRLRPVPVAAIAPHLRQPETAAAAAYALARTRVPAGARLLLPHAASPDTHVRAHVARGLARPAAGDSLGTEARAALGVLALDPHPHVRINAVRSLATYGAGARERVLAATRDPDANVRVAASEVLDQVLAADSAAYRAAWAADTGLAYRANVAAAAMRGGLPLDRLRAGPEPWRAAGDWRLRAAAAGVAGQAPTPDVVASLALPATRDADPRVRAAAWRALARWVDSATAPGSEWRAAMLDRGLRDDDAFVRAAALGALATRPRASEVPAVLEAYERAAGDGATDARLAALRYVEAAWRADSASFAPGLRERLRALTPPPDPLERLAGRRIPLLSAWPGGSGAPRAPSWYESVVREVLLPALRGTPPRVDIRTDRGPIGIVLYGTEAPLTVHNFLTLARSGFYRGARFHRVVPNFVAQDGDPRGDGEGGPGYAIRDELNRRRYARGTIGMALSGPDTGGSQYFITHSPQPHLDGHYTVFGRIVSGWEVLDRIVQGDRIADVQVR